MGVKVDKYGQELEKNLAAGMGFEEAHNAAADAAAIAAVKKVLDKKQQDQVMYKAKSATELNPVNAPKGPDGKVDLEAMAKKLIAGGMDPNEVDIMKRHLQNRRNLETQQTQEEVGA